MNSYFEQSTGGFYGGHHHQSSAAAQHHDPASAAAYRSFPLGLGMSPYASSQHHHHHLAAAAAAANSGSTRPPQDSPYDASVASACKLYSQSGSQDSGGAGGGYGASTGSGSVQSSKDCKQQEQAVAAAVAAHQNGYAAVMAAAAVKDVWQTGGASAGGQPGSGGSGAGSVVRPSACTPDGSRLGSATGYSGLVGSAPDAASSPGNNGASRSLGSASWNTCSLNSSAASQPVSNQLHQQSASHTFYPWMAIAGEFFKKCSMSISSVWNMCGARRTRGDSARAVSCE
ncbi:hypothetical protein QAD02_005414 [Eretmocerus hayati]|uniref:Uncharacterized protein n=1 Tax=Eretmocerus hayati TaxID=131215 RepID=A0ACC2NSQ2_9HYME|nr:hypothetical protein QAD02_005414 [Eretmocerus hayati]